ncbi:MAG: DUF697 domain-containing protein [Deltaproteobacteria bacterium]|nr:DUF697 domain-containing protein [Deltaproteobacteria bacterium]
MTNPTHGATFDRVLSGDWSEVDEVEKAIAVHEVLQVSAIAASAVSIQPLPFVDMVLIAPIQIGMVQSIGRIYGHRLDKKAVVEILSTFGASLVTQGALMSAAKLIPFVGWLVTVPMAYAMTWAVGEVAHYYFRMGRGVPPSELSSMFDRVYRQKKQERNAAHQGASSVQDKLRDLVNAHQEGLIDDDEFEAAKAKVLDQL